MRRRVFGCLIGLALAGLAGCSGSGGDVSGTVKIGGKTVTSGMVVIQDAKGHSASGFIKKEASYTVVAPPTGKGVVLLKPAPPVEDSAVKLPEGKGVAKETTGTPMFPIPSKYSSPKTSDMEITIGGASQTFNIDKPGDKPEKSDKPDKAEKPDTKPEKTDK